MSGQPVNENEFTMDLDIDWASLGYNSEGTLWEMNETPIDSCIGIKGLELNTIGEGMDLDKLFEPDELKQKVNKSRRGPNKINHVVEFLLSLLNNPEYNEKIWWLNEEHRIFRFAQFNFFETKYREFRSKLRSKVTPKTFRMGSFEKRLNETCKAKRGLVQLKPIKSKMFQFIDY